MVLILLRKKRGERESLSGDSVFGLHVCLKLVCDNLLAHFSLLTVPDMYTYV